MQNCSIFILWYSIGGLQDTSLASWTDPSISMLVTAYVKGPSHIQNGARPTSLLAKKRIFVRMTAGVCSITAGSAAIFRDRPAFAGHRNLFLIQRFSNGRISDLRNMTCTKFSCPIYARSGRRRRLGRTSGGARPSVARLPGGRRQIY